MNYGPIATTATADKTFSLDQHAYRCDFTHRTIPRHHLRWTFSRFVRCGRHVRFIFESWSNLFGRSSLLADSCRFTTSNDTLDITYHNGVSAVRFHPALCKVAADSGFLTISDGATYNYGNVATGGSLDKTFTITNGGGATATISGSALAAPYSYKGGGAFPGTGGTCGATLRVWRLAHTS